MKTRPALAAFLVLLAGAPFVAWADDDKAATPNLGTTGGEPFAVINGERQTAPSIPMGDPATIARIIDEGKNRSQVMKHLEYLSLEIGPRLTGSSRLERANIWAKEQFESFGLTARLHKWGEIPVRFDRGPSTGVVYQVDDVPADAGGAQTREPRKVRDLEFSTLAWTPGTNGPVRGRVVKEPMTEEEYNAVRGELNGAWVLLRPPPVRGQRGVRNRAADRYEQRAAARRKVAEGEPVESIDIRSRLVFDGVAGFISPSRDERVWTGGYGGWRRLDPTKPETWPKDVEVTVRQSDYDFINSRLADNEPIEVEFDLDHQKIAGPIPVYNTIAEIRGSEFPDEVVIVSGHLDSWDGPGSQGTTDNGTGSSVTIETARILAAVGAKPKRTIRFILWTGEEQGLLGSRAYVQEIKDDWDKIVACFVDDGGTNYQGGLPAHEVQVPYLAAATAPVNATFPDKTVNIRVSAARRTAGGGSSDHASFLAVGIPGFFWDEVGRADYGRGWHTQYDRIDLAIPEYLVQSATCSAITAYNLACAPEMLPRPPREEPATERPREQPAPAAEPEKVGS